MTPRSAERLRAEVQVRQVEETCSRDVEIASLGAYGREGQHAAFRQVQRAGWSMSRTVQIAPITAGWLGRGGLLVVQTKRPPCTKPSS